MAATKITPVEIKAYNEVFDTPTLTQIDQTDGGYFVHDSADEKTLVLVEATGATTFKVLQGNGVQAVVDFEFTLASGAKKALMLESGFVKVISGEDKGKIRFTGNVKVGVLVLK